MTRRAFSRSLTPLFRDRRQISRDFSSEKPRISFRWLDLRGSGLSVLERLVMEECLLRHNESNWLIVGAHSAHPHRFIQTSTPDYMIGSENPNSAIVLGIGGKPNALLNKELVRKEGCLAIKRFSGGGTVVLDHNSIWTTIIGRKSSIPIDAFPNAIMEWSAEELFGPTFYRLRRRQKIMEKRSNGNSKKQRPTLVMDNKSCGAAENSGKVVQLERHESSVLKADQPSVPQFALRENDYVLGERKMGGNAQAIVKDGWLHHTSFLWDFDEDNMAYLKLPDKRPEYRLDRSHRDFLVTLSETYSSLSKNDFQKALLEALMERYDVKPASVMDAKMLVDGQGGLQHWFDNHSRTKILPEI